MGAPVSPGPGVRPWLPAPLCHRPAGDVTSVVPGPPLGVYRGWTGTVANWEHHATERGSLQGPWETTPSRHAAWGPVRRGSPGPWPQDQPAGTSRRPLLSGPFSRSFASQKRGAPGGFKVLATSPKISAYLVGIRFFTVPSGSESIPAPQDDPERSMPPDGPLRTARLPAFTPSPGHLSDTEGGLGLQLPTWGGAPPPAERRPPRRSLVMRTLQPQTPGRRGPGSRGRHPPCPCEVTTPGPPGLTPWKAIGF